MRNGRADLGYVCFGKEQTDKVQARKVKDNVIGCRRKRMTQKELKEKLGSCLNQLVLIADPEYIVGEDKSISQFKKWLDDCESGMMGAVILGQIGNGKTHFLRYLRKKYSKEAVGIYMPDMFFNGPLIDSLNGLYRLLFQESTNKPLGAYLEWWAQMDKEEAVKKYTDNQIIRYLSICDNADEEKLALDYFSNKDLFPDQISYLRKKFAAKKRFINNENEFVKAFVDALQFIQYVTGKKILLLIDEVDKVYSNSTNKVSLSKVGYKILTTYRTVFDYLNNNKEKGIIAVGATIEAWEVLSHQAAFERRFKDHRVVLKTPKEKKDVAEFVSKRLEENGMVVDTDLTRMIEKYVSDLTENERKSWAVIISALQEERHMPQEKVQEDPQAMILDVLDHAFAPLTWEQMLSQSDVLRRIYPNGKPARMLQSMQKEGKIVINDDKPNTYEIA
jgi:hypothetical protein